MDGEQGGGTKDGSEAHGTRGEQVGLDELRPAPKHVGADGRNRDGPGRSRVTIGVDGVQGCGGGKDKAVIPEKEGEIVEEVEERGGVGQGQTDACGGEGVAAGTTGVSTERGP